ncbi:hypothetical protein FB107DRAFT_294874 [Schizophyllum commune]
MLTTPSRFVYHLGYYSQMVHSSFIGALAYQPYRDALSGTLVLVGACQCQPLTSSSPCFFRAAPPPQSLLALDHDGDDDDDDHGGEEERRPWPAHAEGTAGTGR